MGYSDIIPFYVTAISSAVACVTAYYVFFVCQKPKIYTGNKKMRKFLHDHVKYSEKTFWPAPLIWNGILQTVFSISRRLPKYKLPYERDIVKLRDGGQVGLDYLPAAVENNSGNKLTVLFLPGLTSSSQTSYVKSLVLAITNGGADVFVLNNRGIGGVPLSTPKSYSAATINDLMDILSYLQSKRPGEKFLVIGTSFGGITLNRYLTKEHEAAKNFILGGLIICSPFDLEGASKGIEGPITKRLINYPICADLKRRMQYYDSMLKDLPWYSVEKMKKCRTVREFDRAITSQSYGFVSDADYYAECSSIGRLHLLPVPVYALNATDDPIQYGKYLPIGEAEIEGSKLTLITTSRGGHLGFLEGFSPIRMKAFHWMERFAQDFVQAVLNHSKEFADA